MGSKEVLENTINQAISDFDVIKASIEECGVDVPTGTDTREYGSLIRSFNVGIESKLDKIIDIENSYIGGEIS